MKDSKSSMFPPREGQLPNSWVVMHHKINDKIQGVKTVSHYDKFGMRDYEIHTMDHKGIKPHVHMCIDGKPVGDPLPLNSALEVILDKAIKL